MFRRLHWQIRLVARKKVSRQSFGSHSTPLPGCFALDDMIVTRQPTANTCVPASLDMLLEYYSPGRLSTQIDYCKLQVDGLEVADVIGFVDVNLTAIGMRIARGRFGPAIERGQPFIAFVIDGEQGHAVLVQGIQEVDGSSWLIVRDPARGAYRERPVDFEARLVQDRSGVGYPAIWAIE